jgi:hypothetical protein
MEKVSTELPVPGVCLQSTLCSVQIGAKFYRNEQDPRVRRLMDSEAIFKLAYIHLAAVSTSEVVVYILGAYYLLVSL